MNEDIFSDWELDLAPEFPEWMIGFTDSDNDYD